MRRMLSALLASVLASIGLVALVSGPAAADCPYTGCIETNTRIDAPGRASQGSRVWIGVRVTAPSNVQPKGRVILRVRREAGGYVFQRSKPYRGTKVWFRTTRLQQLGEYLIVARYKKKPDSRWSGSRDTDTIRVVRG